jgi:hypothetical protein
VQEQVLSTSPSAEQVLVRDKFTWYQFMFILHIKLLLLSGVSLLEFSVVAGVQNLRHDRKTGFTSAYAGCYLPLSHWRDVYVIFVDYFWITLMAP